MKILEFYSLEEGDYIKWVSSPKVVSDAHYTFWGIVQGVRHSTAYVKVIGYRNRENNKFFIARGEYRLITLKSLVLFKRLKRWPKRLTEAMLLK